MESFCRAVSWLHLEVGTFVREARLGDGVEDKADRAAGSGYLVATDFCRTVDNPDAEAKPFCHAVTDGDRDWENMEGEPFPSTETISLFFDLT